MNSRDFCFWLHGYMELTTGEYPPSVVWNSILEHLAIAQADEDYSRDEFEGVVVMLTGFTSVAGNEPPTESQWTRIVDIVAEAFNKVTSTLETEELKKDDNSTDFSDAIKKALDEIHKTQPHIPPYQPYPVSPWNDDTPNIPATSPWELPPQIICSAEDSPVFCTSAPSVNSAVACTSLDSAYDSHYKDNNFGDMYDIGTNLADSKLGNA